MNLESIENSVQLNIGFDFNCYPIVHFPKFKLISFVYKSFLEEQNELAYSGPTDDAFPVPTITA
jgi:hypothetical protein